MAIAATNRRQAAAPPPPPPPPEESLYDYIWRVVKEGNPGFAEQGDNEPLNDFLLRIVGYISPPAAGDNQPHMAEEQWNTFDAEAQGWFNAAAQAYLDQQELPVPDGYYVPEEEQQPPTPPPVQAATRGAFPLNATRGASAPTNNGAAPLHPNPQIAAMMEGKARKKAEREAAAAGGNGARPPLQAQAPQSAARGRGVPPAAPVATAPPAAPVYGRRGAAPQPAPQPSAPPAVPAYGRRAAPPPPAQPPQPRRAQAVGRQSDVVDDLRAQIINNPNMSPEDLIAYARANNYVQQDRSLQAMHSQVRSILNLLERMGVIAPFG